MTTVHAATLGRLTVSAIADDRADYELYQVGLHAHIAVRPDDRMSFAEVKLVLRRRTLELGAVWDGRRLGREQPSPSATGQCVYCGCTEDRACPGGCYWTDVDACSSCVPVNELLDCPVVALHEFGQQCRRRRGHGGRHEALDIAMGPGTILRWSDPGDRPPVTATAAS